MKTLEYVGPYQGEVHVALPEGTVSTVNRRVEVSDDEAKSLLLQPENWRRPIVEKAVEDAKARKGA